VHTEGRKECVDGEEIYKLMIEDGGRRIYVALILSEGKPIHTQETTPWTSELPAIVQLKETA
jgi:hypothetical protein